MQLWFLQMIQSDFEQVNGAAMKDHLGLSLTPMPWVGPVDAIAVPQHGGYELFVDECVVGHFLKSRPRRVVEMARKKEMPAHPMGRTRMTWRFRLSEIDAHFRLRGPRQGVAPISNERSELQGRKESWIQ